MQINRKLPENFQEVHLPYFSHALEITLPETGCQSFNNYFILFKNGILMTPLKIEKQSLLYDKRLKETGLKYSFLKFILKSLIKNKIGLLKQRREYVTIINEWTNSYFHWCSEALPKLMVAISNGYKPVVLLPEIYNSSFQRRSLELLNVEYQYFSANILVGKGIILPGRLAPYPAPYNPIVMKNLISLLKLPVENKLNKGKRIYVSRQSAGKRKVNNEEQVVELLRKFEFCILETENFDLAEQISIMHHVEIFISIHGAGLTNIMFCKPGTKVLELSLQNQAHDKCYFTLANEMNLSYYYQFCKSVDSKEDYHSSDLVVDMQELNSNLLKLIN